MNIGITGSTGVLGRILNEKLKAPDYNISNFKGDIREMSEIRKWLVDSNFDLIFHFASIVPVKKVNNDPLNAMRVNAGGTFNLLYEIINNRLNPWIFYPSSSHVYQSSDNSISENDLIKPQSLYGETKLHGELVIEYVKKFYEINICIGRIFSFYHDYQETPFLYPTTIERLSNHNKNKSFEVYGGNNTRDFSNAEEIIDIIIKLSELKYNGIINIGSGKGTKVVDFVKSLSEYELATEVIQDFQETSLVADITKLEKLIS